MDCAASRKVALTFPNPNGKEATGIVRTASDLLGMMTDT